MNLKLTRLVLPVLTVVLGLALYLAVSDTSSYEQSKSWPMASGTVLSCKVVERVSSEGPWYQPEVQIEYMVDGRKYVALDVPIYGTHINVSDWSASQKIASRYPVGSTVTVYYNPNNPRQETLIPGGGNSRWPEFILPYSTVGLFACLVVWLVRLFAWIRKRLARNG